VTPFETIVLTSPTAGATAVLAPARGGMVTRLTLAGRELFYLDEATLLDPSRSLRGGNPVLFPSPGPLADGRFAWGGRSGAMPNHGLARQRPFSVVSADETSAVLELRADAGTRAELPWDFVLELRYALEGGALVMDARIENRDDAPMPFALGHHPYFLVPAPEKPKVVVPTRATRAWDNFGKRMVDVTAPIDVAAPQEVDLHLVDHGGSEAALVLPDGARIVVRGSEEFGRWVVWTQPGKDFVCLEPWTAAANALNTGERLLVIEPGGERRLRVSITLEVAGPERGC
jgi:galactose mutarotase-like enzyme